MLAVIGGVGVAPHLQADLQGLLEPLEALRRAREEQAESLGLLAVPRRADAEPRAALGEHVERGDDLGEHAGVAVADRGDPREQLDLLGARGEVAERGVGLEHLVLGRAEHLDLEQVVHHAHALEPGLLGRDDDARQVVGEAGAPRRVGEVCDVQADLHGLSPPGARA